jgi:pimeloyl-ACP methyl ester carboxylesterase
LSHGVVLARHGYGVLMLDTRGHGRSEGRAMDFGWYAGRDVPAAVSFLSSRPDVVADRIGVVGLSMGGEQAISAAAPDPRVRVVIAEGVTGMQAADHGWLPGGIAGAIERGLEWVQYEAADLLTDASKPTPMRRAIVAMGPKPLLLIAGGATTSEVDAGRWLRAASPSTVDLWIVPGAGHTRALATDPDAWEARVTSLLDAELGGTQEG